MEMAENKGNVTSTRIRQLMSAARAMKPRLKERAAAAEDDRKIPQETIDEFREAGFLKILQPKKYGGYELEPQVLMDVIYEVASACGSSGWTLAVLGLHQWEVQLLPDEAMEAIWGENPDVLLSSAYAPTCEVQPVDGGYLLSGKWPYSSGCDHAEWAIVGGLRPPANEGEPPVHCGFFVPRSEYQILDEWKTMGLAGTGSNTLQMEQVFVPEHMHHPIFSAAPTPPDDASPIYKIPFGLVFVDALSSTIHGIAQGVFDQYVERNQARLGAMDQSRYADNPDVHRYIAETEFVIRSARCLRRENLQYAYDTACEGRELSITHRARHLWESGKSVHACAEAIGKLYSVSGAHTIFEGDSLQRAFRDCQAGVTHMAFNFNLHGRNYGAMLMGHPNTLTFI